MKATAQRDPIPTMPGLSNCQRSKDTHPTPEVRSWARSVTRTKFYSSPMCFSYVEQRDVQYAGEICPLDQPAIPLQAVRRTPDSPSGAVACYRC